MNAITASSKTNPQPTFLYPKSRQYPMDETCEKIVRALEKRNWKVPGIEVTFNSVESGSQKRHYVSVIKGDDFQLLFGRENERIAAICTITIPRRELQVFATPSLTRYFEYSGNHWESDKEAFMMAVKPFGSELYSTYYGGADLNGWHKVYNLNPYLIKSKGGLIDRENPLHYKTEDVFNEFNQYLTDQILNKVQSLEEVAQTPVIPYPAHLGPIYVRIDQQSHEQIVQGQNTGVCALKGGGQRLMSPTVKNDGSFPKKAYDGFRRGTLHKEDQLHSSAAIIKIDTKYADNIFIVDCAPYKEYRKQCLEKKDPLAEEAPITEEENDESKRILARTIVPIHQYQNNYKDPMVLIGDREFAPNEVEIVAVAKD